VTVIPAAERQRIVERATALLKEPGATQRTVAAKLGIGQSTLCGYLKLAGVEPPNKPSASGPEPAGVSRSGANLTITSPPAVKPTAPPDERTGHELLQKHGYDPDEWVVTSVRISEWGNPESPMFQHRVNATRKDGLLVIPDLTDFEPYEFGQVEEYAPRRVALIPDLHAPFHDAAAYHAVLDLIACEAPEEVIFLGDVADNSFLSKHRTHPRFVTSLNQTNDAVVKNFRLAREAAPGARMIFVPGNHDARVLYYAQDLAPELDHVRPGKLFDGEPEPESSIGYRQLWQLDRLGIELVDEDWKLAQHSITPELTARHGYLTGNNSERKLLEKHGRSQVHGHDHRGSLIYRTKHDPLDIRVAMSCGTLSEVKSDGLGYEPDPDWTPGAGWCQVWDDGLFQLSFMPYIKNKLLTPWGAAYEGRE
jgi:hypothetical protein